MCLYRSFVQADELLADHKTQADSFTVDLSSAAKLAKLCEELLHFLFFYSFAAVKDVDFHHLFGEIICRNYLNPSSLGEF